MKHVDEKLAWRPVPPWEPLLRISSVRRENYPSCIAFLPHHAALYV